MSVEQNKVLCRRVHDEVFQQGRLEVADEIIAADCRFHGSGFPPGTGPAVMKQDATTYRNAFTIDRLTREVEVAEGDTVAHRWSFTGTHKGELGGIPATGRQVNITGMDIFRVRDGKIVDFYQEFDQMLMMQQLGVVPAGASA